MSDTIIGHVIIYGEQAKRLFARQTAGDSISIRLKGVIIATNIPGRPLQVNSQSMYPQPNQEAMISIEIEEIQ